MKKVVLLVLAIGLIMIPCAWAQEVNASAPAVTGTAESRPQPGTLVKYSGDCAGYSASNPEAYIDCSGRYWYQGHEISSEYLIRTGLLKEEAVQAPTIETIVEDQEPPEEIEPQAVYPESRPVQAPVIETGVEEQGPPEEIEAQAVSEEAPAMTSVTHTKPSLMDKWGGTITWIIILIVIAMTILAVVKAYTLEVVFFNDFIDTGLMFIPVLGIIIGFFIQNEKFLWLFWIAIAYHLVQAFRLNWEHKWLALCVAVGRMLLGFVAPIFIIAGYLHGVERRKGESDVSHEIRKIEHSVISAALMAGLLKFIEMLTNGEEVRSSRAGSLAAERVKGLANKG